jgi:hypothetical protein
MRPILTDSAINGVAPARATARGLTDPDATEPMQSILTRGAAWCANRLPTRLAWIWPPAVIVEAIAQMQQADSRAIALAGVQLRLGEVRRRLECIERGCPPTC